MKKVLLCAGVIAMLSACTGNGASSGPGVQDTAKSQPPITAPDITDSNTTGGKISAADSLRASVKKDSVGIDSSKKKH